MARLLSPHASGAPMNTRRKAQKARKATPGAPVVFATALLCLSAGCESKTAVNAPHPRSLVILGIDGMDPVLTQRYVDEGMLPNVSALIRDGSFAPLQTTNPPQSPVAWSTFITGQPPEVHGIFDFLHRDARDLSPYLSTSRQAEPWSMAGWELPLTAGGMELLRKGKAFWQTLETHGIPSQAYKIPANFPPAPSRMNVSTSGMGTPDVQGTYGTFQIFSSSREDEPLNGGVVHHLKPSGKPNGARKTYAAHLDGPPDPGESHGYVQVPFEVSVDAPAGSPPVAAITVADRTVVLERGQWSDWVPVEFGGGLVSSPIAGMVRIYAQHLTPHVELYVSPVNMDPVHPLMPISEPAPQAARLAQEIGRFYTQGMAEDTKALAAGVLSDTEFLQQAHLVFEERLRLLDAALGGFNGGLLFFYVSSIDQISHVFWRSLEEDADPADAAFADVIPSTYRKVDALIGTVRKRIGNTPLIVMSDHGFSPFRHKVNLNNWLANSGFLSVADETKPEFMGHVDWENTQAYAVGLNQLFVNLAGREPHGVVPPEERDLVLSRLKRELESWRDGKTGLRVVTRATVVDAPAFPDAPDMIVGYNRTFRSSDESAQGMLADEEVVHNHDKWSGDHCMQPEHVPGVIISSVPLPPSESSLLDFAPSILDFFEVPHTDLPGQSFWGDTPPGR